MLLYLTRKGNLLSYKELLLSLYLNYYILLIKDLKHYITRILYLNLIMSISVLYLRFTRI